MLTLYQFQITREAKDAGNLTLATENELTSRLGRAGYWVFKPQTSGNLPLGILVGTIEEDGLKVTRDFYYIAYELDLTYSQGSAYDLCEVPGNAMEQIMDVSEFVKGLCDTRSDLEGSLGKKPAEKPRNVLDFKRQKKDE